MSILGTATYAALTNSFPYALMNGDRIACYIGLRGDLICPSFTSGTYKYSGFGTGQFPGVNADGSIPQTPPRSYGLMLSQTSQGNAATLQASVQAKKEMLTFGTPNNPVDGWAIRTDDSSFNAWVGNQNFSAVGGTLSTSGLDANGPLSVTCTVNGQASGGASNKIQVQHVWMLQSTGSNLDKVRLRCTVTITNNTSTTQTNVRYCRAVVPAPELSGPWARIFGAAADPAIWGMSALGTHTIWQLGFGVYPTDTNSNGLVFTVSNNTSWPSIANNPDTEQSNYKQLVLDNTLGTYGARFLAIGGGSTLYSTSDYRTDTTFQTNVVNAINADVGTFAYVSFQVHTPTIASMAPGASVSYTFYYLVPPIVGPAALISCDGLTLTGTGITGAITPMQNLATRVARQAAQQFNAIELWYQDRSNALWYLFPIQPETGVNSCPAISREYRQPALLTCTFADNLGLLWPENLNSAYNVDMAGNYAPLMDEARKVLLRVGAYCFTNLASAISPTSSLAPSVGSLGILTDGLLGNIAAGSANYAQFAPTSTATFALTVDLGTSQFVRHTVIRFGSLIGTATLPAAVQVATSQDNVTWSSWPIRPVGGAGGAGLTQGDWDDDSVGRTIEIARTDIEFNARYVRFTIFPTGSQTIFIDELAVYGGQSGTFLGCNIFTGYLGDELQFTPEGKCVFRATDVLKRLADNNENRMSGRFQNAEVGDMVYSLLTSTTYWQGTGIAYDAPFPSQEVGWVMGANLTGMVFPVWQGQGNSMLGYAYDLLHEVGFILYADGQGVLQVLQPTYKQRVPDRICIAALDGNGDVRDCVRSRSGKDLRNVADVSNSRTLGGGVRSVVLDPNSVARYGRRRVIITDPVTTTTDLQRQVARYLLRDYAWRLQTLNNRFQPGFDTQLKQIFGFRAPARPHLYSKGYSATMGLALGSLQAGNSDLRQRELWSLEAYEEHISVADWWGTARWIPYVPYGPDPPTGLAVSTGGTLNLTLTWTAPTDPHVQYVRGYLSAMSDTIGFVQEFQVGVGTTTQTFASGYLAGTQVWLYLTSVDDQGYESVSGNIVSLLVAGSSASESDWAVTTLAAAYNPPTQTDGAGNYSYEFLLTWTAPTAGYKRMEMYYAINTLPSNQNDRGQWTFQDEFHGIFQFPGSSLTWYARIRNPGALLSGTKVYFRMWTTTRNTSDAGGWFGSNVTFATIP